MKGLTDRQLQVLAYIAERIRERGYPPTIREIGNELGIRSTNGVNDHLKALERKGYINRSGSKSRAIMVTDLPEELAATHSLSGAAGRETPEPYGGPEMLSVPLLGRIAAGLPIEAIEEAEEHIQVDPSMIASRGGQPVFACFATMS